MVNIIFRVTRVENELPEHVLSEPPHSFLDPLVTNSIPASFLFKDELYHAYLASLRHPPSRLMIEEKVIIHRSRGDDC